MDESFVYIGKKHPTDGELKRGKTSKGTVRHKGKSTGVGKSSDVKTRTVTVYETNNNNQRYDFMDWFFDAWDDGETLTFKGFVYDGEYESKPFRSYNVTKIERGETAEPHEPPKPGEAPPEPQAPSGDWGAPPQEPVNSWATPPPENPSPPATTPPQQAPATGHASYEVEMQEPRMWNSPEVMGLSMEARTIAVGLAASQLPTHPDTKPENPETWISSRARLILRLARDLTL